MNKITLIIVFSFSILANNIFGKNLIFWSEGNKFINFVELQELLHNYEIIILGENHDNASHHSMQEKIISALANSTPVDVGLEFIAWTKQGIFDEYQLGNVEENVFLEAVNWGGIPFDFYRPFITLALESGAHAFGINAPRTLTRKIAKNGIASLTPDEAYLLPPNFELGSELYFQRFKDTMEEMGNHMPPHAIQNFFEAQSTWDDSMAYYTHTHRTTDHPFVVIVGNFHVAYKLGLPSRLLLREDCTLAAISQVDAKNLDHENIMDLTTEDPDYGMLGDFIIFTDVKEK